MTDLDQRIRAYLADPHASVGRIGNPVQAAAVDRLADAIRAVLDLPPITSAALPPSPIAACTANGYNQALADVRVEIADRLGIQPPAEAADYALERDSGAALGAVVRHVEGQDRP